jgi:hypothetical protein
MPIRNIIIRVTIPVSFHSKASKSHALLRNHSNDRKKWSTAARTVKILLAEMQIFNSYIGKKSMKNIVIHLIVNAILSFTEF